MSDAEQRGRDLADRVWTTKAGDRVHLTQMREGHLRNCLEYLARYGYHPPLGGEWALLFEEELERRRQLREQLAQEELCRPVPWHTFEVNSFDDTTP